MEHKEPDAPKPPYATAIAAETAFYAAFARCDFKAMNNVWAGNGVICIHPGAAALVGRDAVMRSWANILTNTEPPNLRVQVLSRTVNNGLAVHVVEERIAPAGASFISASLVLATNVYRQDNDGWHLLQHHASVPVSTQHRMGGNAPGSRTLQ